MKFEALFLFLILLLGLVLSSFLGDKSNRENFSGTFDIEVNKKQTNTKDSSQKSGNNTNNNYDNYNHYSGSSSQLTSGTTFYGKNGGSVKVSIQSNGKLFLIVTLSKDDKSINFIKSSAKDLVFYGPNGETALVINHYGHNAIKITTSKGTYIYTMNAPSSHHDNQSDYNKNFSAYKDTSLTYYGSTGVIGSNPNTNNDAYTGSSAMTKSSMPSYNYSNSLPPGIPRSQIPRGQEDLYILKSEIVPPVCPACPTSAACPREEKCPPCPACARCPEPAFECKKVPNYNSINNGYLPVPVVNDFSTFGM
jgi:hypothetical protein